jgi:hypothetical protein
MTILIVEMILFAIMNLNLLYEEYEEMKLRKDKKDIDNQIDGGIESSVKGGGLEMIMSGLPRRVLKIEEEKAKVSG